MKLVKIKNIEVDCCPRCVGYWFDSKELDKLMGGAKSFEEQAYLGEPLGTDINCPDCSEQMYYTTIKDVTIDFCKNCEGIWLDSGEYKDLAKHLPERRLTDSEDYTPEVKEPEGFLRKVRIILTRK
jgi:Zn-finger nucleic acid-binding protein